MQSARPTLSWKCLKLIKTTVESFPDEEKCCAGWAASKYLISIQMIARRSPRCEFRRELISVVVKLFTVGAFQCVPVVWRFENNEDDDEWQYGVCVGKYVSKVQKFVTLSWFINRNLRHFCDKHPKITPQKVCRRKRQRQHRPASRPQDNRWWWGVCAPVCGREQFWGLVAKTFCWWCVEDQGRRRRASSSDREVPEGNWRWLATWCCFGPSRLLILALMLCGWCRRRLVCVWTMFDVMDGWDEF